MDFDDRLGMFLLGCLIGSVVGYIVRLLQETREKIDRVDKTVKDAHRAPRDEKGFMRYRFVADILMLTALTITVMAAFSTNQVNNNLKDTQKDLAVAQDRIDHISSCTAIFLGDALEALNARTEYSGQQAQANIDLQKAQAQMLRILLHVPPHPSARQGEATQEYFDTLLRFLNISQTQRNRADANEYPTLEDFETCLSNKLSQED